MPARWKIAIGATTAALGGMTIFAVAQQRLDENAKTEARNKMLDRLRSGPFDDEVDARKMFDDFRTPFRATDYYRNKFLRVRARFYETIVDKNGDLAVLVFGGHNAVDPEEEKHEPVLCVYIGDFHTAHMFTRRDPISLHSYGAGKAEGAVILANCVIEPP